MDPEVLPKVHPIFAIDSTKIFVNEVVQKVNTHGTLQERFLIVTNSGIFLLVKRSFPKSVIVSRVIPFSQLLLIIVDENSMQFFCGGVTMILQHKKHVEISAIVYSVKNGLFSEKPRPPKIQISPLVQERFDSSLFVFESENIICDRFLSLCLSIPAKNFQIQRIIELREKLLTAKRNYQVTAGIVASPFSQAYASAIAMDTEEKEITFSDVSLCNISDSVLEILDYSMSSVVLTFKNVAFVDFSKIYVPVKKIQSGILDVRFIQCDLTSHDFNVFFDVISRSGCIVSSLEFDICSFTKQTYEAAMKTVLNGPGFATLKKLKTTRMSPFNLNVQLFILQLFGSDFLIKKKNLKTLIAMDSSLHVDQMVPGIFRYDNGVELLNFAGNKLDSSYELDSLADFRQLQVLDVSRCEFSGPAIISLFAALSRCSNAPKTLVANGLRMPSAGWFAFFSSLPTFVTNLASFSWMNNPMTAPQASAFVSFLVKQKKMTEFAISSDSYDSATIESLASGIEESRFERFTMKNEKQPAASIVPIIKSLRNAKFIELYNQGGGDQVLAILASYAKNGKLEELHFDGTAPSSIDKIIDFCNELQESRVKISSWPDQDVRSLIQKEPIKNRSVLAKRAETAKNSFSGKMGEKKDEEVTSSSKKVVKESRSVEDILSEREPVVSSVLKECFDLTADDKLEEPLVDLFNDIQTSISINFLLSDTTM